MNQSKATLAESTEKSMKTTFNRRHMEVYGHKYKKNWFNLTQFSISERNGC